MATSADWNMWLGQGQSRQVDPLAPLNQQFGGSLTGAPAQGYGQTSINVPTSEWSRWGAPSEGDGDRMSTWNPFAMMREDSGGSGGVATPTAPPNAPALVPATQPQVPAPQKATLPVPKLVNPKTGGAGGTPTATGWTDTSAQSQTLAAPSLAREQFEDQMNRAGDRGGAVWDQNTGWHGGGSVAAGTAIGTTGAKTWVNYDGNRDTYLHQNGQSTEPSWMRVNRWTTDGVYEHGLTPQEAHNAALARLKRDFELNGQDWRQSGYDLSNVQSAAPGQDFAKANAVGAVPAATDPKIDPATGKPKVETKVDPQTGLPQTGGGTTTPGAPGLFTDEGSVSAAAQSPAAALLAFQKAAGGVNKSGPLGKYRENLMSQALQAYLGAYGIGGNIGNGGALGNANQGIEEMMSRLASGQGVGDWLRGATQKAMDGVDFSGMDGEQIKNILSLVGGAGTFGMGPMGQYAMNNALDDLEYQVGQQGLFEPLVNPDGSKPTSVLANPNNRRTFEELMRKYQAML